MRSVNVVEDYSAYPLIIMLTIPPKFPIASEIAFNTILIIIELQLESKPISYPSASHKLL
jgi:hypothetical protein